MEKVIIVVDGNDIAPRFDLALELLIVSLGKGRKPAGKRDVVLARPSVEELCRVVSAENAHTVICGGIEKDHLQYLGWKNVEVIHSVIGPAEVALRRFLKGSLNSGDILLKERKA
ncbi:MAG: NifB/NifX family molybdenum-iron cluster-binding protein [Syntrophobacteraceae bacterium]